MVELYVPQASDWINAYQGGKQARMTSDKNAATQRAGGLMASGDYAGAAAAVLPYDMATGVQIQKYGAEQEGLERRKGYGQQFAEGKGADAAKAAYSAGDWDEGGQISKALDAASEQQRAQVKANAERIATIVAPIGDMPETDLAGRKSYIAQHRGDLIAAGYSEQQVDGFEPTNANLSVIYSQAMGLKDYLTYRKDQTKPDWAERKNQDGSTTWIDRNSPEIEDPRGATGPAPASGAIDPQHLDAIVRTVYGEARNEAATGQSAVASVILNRARSAGKTPAEIVMERNQFEPWGNPKTRAELEALRPDSPEYQAILRNIAPALSGQDVTGGADHFYSPTAQTALGRRAPAWDNGEGRDLGRHRFFSLGYGGGAPARGEVALAGGPAGDQIAPYEVAAVGATPGPPSAPARRREIQGSAAPLPEWTDLPGGGQINKRTGEKKNLPGMGGPVLPPETGLFPVGDPNLGVYRNKVGQKYQTNRAGTVSRLSGPTDEQVNDTEKKILAINETITLVDAVDEQLARTRSLGPGGRYVVNQAEFARLDSLTKQLQIAYKNAAELGAITGPDVPFIESVAPNPRELMSLVQRGEFRPRLESLAKIAGTKYRAQVSRFNTLGGDPDGLTPLYRGPNSKVDFDAQGRIRKPAAAPTITGAQAKALRSEAAAAIKAGAPRAAVLKRLRESGVTNLSGI